MNPRLLHRPLAVIFDMDGLMLDTEPLAARAWREAASGMGLAFDPTVTHAMVGRTFPDCRQLLVDRHGDAYPVDQLMIAWSATYEAIIARDGLVVKPGLPELLAWLESERIPKGVATSTHHARACAKLQRTGLLSRFSAIVCGDQVTHGKPHPEIFLTVAQRLEVAPARCLVLEDSEPGFRASVSAGMASIIVPDLHAPPYADPFPEPVAMRSLHEVHRFLRELPPAGAADAHETIDARGQPRANRPRP